MTEEVKSEFEDLKQLKERMNPIVSLDPAQYHNDFSLRRYLKAFRTVHGAFQAILRTNRWKADYGVAELHNNKDILEKYSDKAQVLQHRDIVGRPIVYIPSKKHNPSERNIDDLMKYIVYCLEDACKRCFEQIVDNICIVFDLKDFTLSCMDYQMIKNMIWLLNRHYPERLGVCLIINAPPLFMQCWIIIKVWLHENISNKITFVTSKRDLCYYLIPDILPTDVSDGYTPNSPGKEKENIGLQKYDWYVGEMSRQRAELVLKQEDVDGCFVVRNSSMRGMYTLSLYVKDHPQPFKNYQIQTSAHGQFFIAEKHSYSSIPELINYHRHHSGGLASRLNATPRVRPTSVPDPDSPLPPAEIDSADDDDKWEIDPPELVLMEELGAGQFGVVRRGRWHGIDTAIKIMKKGTMSEDAFIAEAKVMTKLQHPNLVQLYGVCTKHRPIYIVTEYMRHGCLLFYLRQKTPDQIGHARLLEMSIQVCKGMVYLEKHNYIHRDLAARNCLVGEMNVVKVADFGLARYVVDDEYKSSGGTKFPLRWAPPEVINYLRYSSKSDVWAFGVLLWEIFTCGKMPYGRMKNPEVLAIIQQGKVLGKPRGCPVEIYNVMRACWKRTPEERSPFRALYKQLARLEPTFLSEGTDNTTEDADQWL